MKNMENEKHWRLIPEWYIFLFMLLITLPIDTYVSGFDRTDLVFYPTVTPLFYILFRFLLKPKRYKAVWF